MNILINLLIGFHILLCLLLVVLVLMQRPKNEGLGAAFGGGMTSDLFGARTTDVLQKVTQTLGIIFFLLTLLLAWLYAHQSTGSNIRLPSTTPAMTTPPPGATPAPAVPGVSPAVPAASPGAVSDGTPAASPAESPAATPLGTIPPDARPEMTPPTQPPGSTPPTQPPQATPPTNPPTPLPSPSAPSPTVPPQK